MVKLQEGLVRIIMEGKMRRRFIAIALFVLTSAYIPGAGTGGVIYTQTAYAADKGTRGNNQNIDSGGAANVGKDLYPYHWADTNQFGDDESYNNLSTGRSEVPYPIHREDH